MHAVSAEARLSGHARCHALGGALTALLLVVGVGMSAEASASPSSRAPRPEVPDRMLLIGDSIASSLADPMQTAARREGSELDAFTREGCGLTHGVPTVAINPSGAAACVEGLDAYLDEASARATGFAAVIWLSSWEINDPLVDGRVLRYGSRAWQKWFGRELDAARARFASPSRKLVLVTIPPNAEGTRADARRSRTLSSAFQGFADKHRDVIVADLARRVCPGDHCVRKVRGVTVRPDNWHFGPAGGRWAAAGFVPAMVEKIRTAHKTGATGKAGTR